jgi:hypothetical protein
MAKFVYNILMNTELQTIKEHLEQREYETLSVYATKCKESKGRKTPRNEDYPIRTDFQRDRDKILHSKSFRRLKHKTQVLLSPFNDHFRTRLTHTLEVAQIARTISRALKLNEDLTEAIALGHDLGHAPFGHCGEAILNEICPHGFKHYLQSVRVVDYIEKQGKVNKGMDDPEAEDDDDADALLDQAIDLVVDIGQASASMLQRRFRIGYSRAGRIIDQMEARGIVSGYEGSKPRQVLISKEEWTELKMSSASLTNEESI